MPTLLIENKQHFHFEIIESVIVHWNKLFNINQLGNSDISIHLICSNTEFKLYIKNKYPYIQFSTPRGFDFYVNCTVYPDDAKRLERNPKSRRRYIAHYISKSLLENPNVYFLTPLAQKNYFASHILPFCEEPKMTTQYPIYIIQGNIDPRRRNYELLRTILDAKYDHKFQIRWVGRGKIPRIFKKYNDTLVFRQNLGFVDYHREFKFVYCTIPLITRGTHPDYYSNRFTSTINYTKAYKAKCLIDVNLQKIYKLKNVQTFTDKTDIVQAFRMTLHEFFKNM